MKNETFPKDILNAIKKAGWKAVKASDAPDVFPTNMLKATDKAKFFQKGKAVVLFYLLDDDQLGLAIYLDGKTIKQKNVIKSRDPKKIATLLKNVEKKMVNEGRMNPDSLVVSIHDYNSFTLVMGVYYDDEFDIETGKIEHPKVIMNRILKGVKIPATVKKTGRGRFQLTFRNNAEMQAAGSAFRKHGYKVTRETINSDKKAAAILKKSKMPLLKK